MKNIILIFVVLFLILKVINFSSNIDLKKEVLINFKKDDENEDFHIENDSDESIQDESNKIYLNQENKVVANIAIPNMEIDEQVYYGHDYLDEHNLILDEDYYLPGNNKEDVVIAGHKEKIGKKLKGLKKEDEIYLTTLSGIYKYVVYEISTPYESQANEVFSNDNQKEDLIIYTCYPFEWYSNNNQRYVVKAKKVET